MKLKSSHVEHTFIMGPISSVQYVHRLWTSTHQLGDCVAAYSKMHNDFSMGVNDSTRKQNES